MAEIYGIEGTSYDGCNGWTYWQLDKFFSTVERAQKYIDVSHSVVKLNIEKSYK